MKNRVKRKLLELGIDPSLTGYDYIIEAVCLVLANRQAYRAKTVRLYTDIAAMYDVTYAKVERNIRTAIHTACYDKRNIKLKETFGVLFDKDFRGYLTNAQFIWGVAEVLSIEDAEV